MGNWLRQCFLNFLWSFRDAGMFVVVKNTNMPTLEASVPQEQTHEQLLSISESFWIKIYFIL